MEKDYYKVLEANVWDNQNTLEKKLLIQKEEIRKEFLEQKNILNNLLIDLYQAIKNQNSNLLIRANDSIYDLVGERFPIKVSSSRIITNINVILFKKNISNFQATCNKRLKEITKNKLREIVEAHFILTNKKEKENYDMMYISDYVNKSIEEIKRLFIEMLNLSRNITITYTSDEITWIRRNFYILNDTLLDYKQKSSNEIQKIYENISSFIYTVYPQPKNPQEKNSETYVYKYQIKVSIVRLLCFLHLSQTYTMYESFVREKLINSIDDITILDHVKEEEQKTKRK